MLLVIADAPGVRSPRVPPPPATPLDHGRPSLAVRALITTLTLYCGALLAARRRRRIMISPAVNRANSAAPP